jgi:hypothetical protein
MPTSVAANFLSACRRIIVLLPSSQAFLGLPRSPFLTWVTLACTLAIAALLVSRLPVFPAHRYAGAAEMSDGDHPWCCLLRWRSPIRGSSSPSARSGELTVRLGVVPKL